MIRIIVELIMFGCTIFTIIHIIQKIRVKKQSKNKKTPKLSELKGKEFTKYIDDLTKDLH